jgi:hypothetical protein
MIDGLEGNAPLQPVGGSEIDVAAASREGSDHQQNLVMSQRIQGNPRVDDTRNLADRRKACIA